MEPRESRMRDVCVWRLKAAQWTCKELQAGTSKQQTEEEESFTERTVCSSSVYLEPIQWSCEAWWRHHQGMGLLTLMCGRQYEISGWRVIMWVEDEETTLSAEMKGFDTRSNRLSTSSSSTGTRPSSVISLAVDQHTFLFLKVFFQQLQNIQTMLNILFNVD